MTRNRYTVELLITDRYGLQRIAFRTESGWDMTPGQACKAATDFVTWYWHDVTDAKALRVYFDGKGWTDAEV